MEKYRTVSEQSIREMVHRFYAKVREDELIGSIFNHALGQRWDAHLERLCDFWSTVLLTSRRYHGDPFHAHLMVQGIERHHFDRWLELFAETLGELYSEERARDIYNRAARMAVRMQAVLYNPPELPLKIVSAKS